jgi:hypothetical protein
MSEITADDLIDKIYDSCIRGDLRSGKTRRDFAGIASTIALDRYNGGSLGARAALAIMLMHGVEAAVAFADDLEHHEDGAR